MLTKTVATLAARRPLSEPASWHRSGPRRPRPRPPHREPSRRFLRARRTTDARENRPSRACGTAARTGGTATEHRDRPHDHRSGRRRRTREKNRDDAARRIESSGSIRSTGSQRIPTEGNFPVSINVDAQPTIVTDGSIRLMLGLEYQPRPGTAQADPPLNSARLSQLNERLTIIVQDGKPLMISQAADPGSDRRITVELRVTVLK